MRLLLLQAMKSQSMDNGDKPTGSIVENECVMVTFRGRVVVGASGRSDVQERGYFFCTRPSENASR